MYLWRDLFPNGQIAGLDLNPVAIKDDSGRLHIFQGFQQDPSVLDRVAAEVAPEGFDIVIDDASHLGEYTRASFWHLFRRHLKPGGIYVIDDWGCAYRNDWADGHRHRSSRDPIGIARFDSSVGRTADMDMPERMRRAVRRAARPVSARVPEKMRPTLENLYMRMTGATMKTRFPSHDYGMAGVIKQLIDAVAIPSIGVEEKGIAENGIETIHVYKSQVFVHKRGRAESMT
ncbi:class I SAM-dependent methyltransferase [Mycobacterium sp. E136]|uniref:class I SAM-dependent methyltransferase n=1 Tax=Mycobacterium sp. E136 TaxID=1834125 RepID=UPI0012E740E7|nr:class I SAM-dependent methyltransferase [Mycobacterium sp. E136]